MSALHLIKTIRCSINQSINIFRRTKKLNSHDLLQKLTRTQYSQHGKMNLRNTKLLAIWLLPYHMSAFWCGQIVINVAYCYNIYNAFSIVQVFFNIWVWKQINVARLLIEKLIFVVLIYISKYSSFGKSIYLFAFTYITILHSFLLRSLKSICPRLQ